jgi:hypothetical protein
MAKSTRGGKRRDGKSQARQAEPNVYPVTDALRFLLHELETKLGLFPPNTGFDGYGRFHAPVLLPPNEAVPPGMRELFAADLAALDRIGKSSERCYAQAIPPLKVYCLPYYYFDGFNAVLYAERDGKFFAAWKEQEMHADRSPADIVAPGPFADFQGVFRSAVSISD